ncbi:hypothetical protein ABLT15_34625 [Paraburkholderia tropica]|uniref:Uncharacterized protein n=1 Tax=Paraburkholderia tropica TaxID=92647 RepID=A0ABX5MBY9_9BURK|nr:hypothetical protein [Paraburkholderia tropica]MBB3004711.1 hypothetical protein [Paraburkholderia tropica]MBB6323508.1 hypothetical protein [Paraburkholderia tropica]PXX05270.1 hypothetical protein C7400_14219 [Paraburkholderia tropica]PZW70589.1 hypothetical protein C7399_14219 [Paraburkholderia tropica]
MAKVRPGVICDQLNDAAALREHLAAGGRRAEIVSGLLGPVERYGDAIREGFPKLKRRVAG